MNRGEIVVTTDLQTFPLEVIDASRVAAPRLRRCGCDGGGWIVTLDRHRYSPPGETGMVRYTRCRCLDDALSHARSGGAGVV
jgi:hypothetical protein